MFALIMGHWPNSDIHNFTRPEDLLIVSGIATDMTIMSDRS
jgi:hypothetical protein